MNKEEFILSLKKININITDEIYDKLNTYYEMIIEYNNHTNITRITEKEEVFLKHFYDSLTLNKIIDLNNQTLLDVGTGAGFPGLVLKIVFPNLKVTLIDSLNKRITFLNSVKEKLNLKDINIYHKRAEEFIIENRGKYDIVTSRAVANLNILSELCIPYVKENGYFIPMKSEIDEELNNSLSAISKLGGILKEKIEFVLPKENSKRTLLKIQKISKTNIKYPRKFAEIKKKPL